MPVSLARPLLCGLIAAGLAACAHYAPLPLDHEARYTDTVSALHGGAAVSAALTQADITRLILQNNPSLKLAGLRRAEARAQAEAGALPPNPSLSGSLGYLLAGAGDATAWTAAIAEPVNGLITLRARRAEARATTAEVDASLAWEAWQTVARGRQLATDILLNEQLCAVQEQMAQTLHLQWDAAGRAERMGDMDHTMTAPMAQATSEADAAAAETERTLASQLARHHVDREQIDTDVNKLTAFYRSFGFFQAKIGRQLDHAVLQIVVDVGEPERGAFALAGFRHAVCDLHLPAICCQHSHRARRGRTH